MSRIAGLFTRVAIRARQVDLSCAPSLDAIQDTEQ
jgi:hypothetical protein